MQGISTHLVPDTLATALSPVAQACAQLDWAVDLYSGPFASYTDYDEANPDNLLTWHEVDDDSFQMGWFRRGFLPRYADRLVLDEFSYYLGFDSTKRRPADLARRLRGGLNPGRETFDAVAEWNLVYIFRVAGGWWEAYTVDRELFERIHRGWCGVAVDSDKWRGQPG